MRNALKVTRGVIALAIAAFAILVTWGIFTALDAAPLNSLPASAQDVTVEGNDAQGASTSDSDGGASSETENTAGANPTASSESSSEDSTGGASDAASPSALGNEASDTAPGATGGNPQFGTSSDGAASKPKPNFILKSSSLFIS